MIYLVKSLEAWGTPKFEKILKAEIEKLPPDLLPLQEGLSQCNYVSGDDFTVIIITASDTDTVIRVKAGISYTGIISGCGCANDPTPDSELTEYCEVLFEIDKATATTTAILLKD